MSGIYWLASYPKSGNTWFRVFLSNLLSESEEPADINSLIPVPIASDRSIFDKYIGYSSAYLTYNELDHLRPEAYRKFAESGDEARFLKIHDAYTRLEDNTRMIPSDVSLAAIYLIRNPLDVAVSFAFHSNITMQESVDKICAKGLSLCAVETTISGQYRQKLFSWGHHVKSWTEQIDIDVHVMHFEDMKKNPYQTFLHAVNFLGLEDRLDRVKKAVEFSDFKVVKNQEEKAGFKEKPPQAKSFFREGESADWKKYLSKDQVKQIVDANGETMVKYGYLSVTGEIVE